MDRGQSASSEQKLFRGVREAEVLITCIQDRTKNSDPDHKGGRLHGLEEQTRKPGSETSEGWGKKY